MYPDNRPIFYNDSQILRVNCSDKLYQELSINDIVEKIQNYPCSSNSWHGGLTYFINNCNFSFNEFRPIIDSITERFLECKDHILNVLHNKKCYLSYLDFSNDKKNHDTNFDADGISYAVGKIHHVLKEFYNNSPNTTDIFINFSNNGVMINETKKLLKNCVSMVADYVNVPFVIENGELLYVEDHNIKDNYFYIRGNSSGAYNTECFFGTNDSNDIQANSLTASVGGMNILPVVGVGMCIAMGIGATYIYNKNYRNINNVEDNLNMGTEMDVYDKVETAGESLTEYHDIV